MINIELQIMELALSLGGSLQLQVLAASLQLVRSQGRLGCSWQNTTPLGCFHSFKQHRMRKVLAVCFGSGVGVVGSGVVGGVVEG
jgi:hypothetical protein